MKNFWRRKVVQTSAWALVCFALLWCLAPGAKAAGPRVTASIVTGQVTLNGQTMENETAQYPLLLYKNITYFPMTYHLCRFLGVTASWDSQTRTLSIDRSEERGNYVEEPGSKRQRGSVSASRVEYAVVVNGVPVDNSQETWPLINYNNITYFPLTWQFAVSSFGWDYAWDSQNGLRIDSTKKEYTPPSGMETGNKKLDAALEALRALYTAGGSFSGRLTDLSGAVEIPFTAASAVSYTAGSCVVTFTAEPFPFFSNGAGVSATYLKGELDSTPQISASGQGDRLQAEKAMEEFRKTELGYLSRCILDLQFTGRRAEKILAAQEVLDDSGAAGWDLTVAYESEGYTGYKARIVLDAEQKHVQSLSIQTENYEVRLWPVNGS